MKDDKSILGEQGFIILKQFFEVEKILEIKKRAESIFQIQFDHFKYDGNDFKDNMIRLFNEQNETFINCGKIIQAGLLELYKLPLEEKLINKLVELGIRYPNMCTRPILFFNHPQLAKQEVYYKTPPHQDWSSMQSSLNSLVVWVPLVNVNKENGSIVVWPGSHRLGILPFDAVGGFAGVQIESDNKIDTELQIGDICIFSTLLVHASGNIENDQIRWSCHFRFTDMLESDFIERGFPNPYIYKPIIQSN